jgi:DNA gyrase subunit B
LADYLSAMDHVRFRPGLYFGGVGKEALHLLIETIADYLLADMLAGRSNSLQMTLQSNQRIQIRDNGPGLPVEFYEKLNQSLLEITMTRISVPRMIRADKANLPYEVSGGLRGMDLVAVNALCSELEAEVARDGYVWRQIYHAGIPQTEVIQVRKLEENESTGTTITFKPDFTILEKNEFDYELLRERMYELATMLKQSTFAIRDERLQPEVEKVYHFENGLIAHLDDLRGTRQPLHFPIAGHTEAKIAKTHYGSYMIQVDFIFQYIQSDDSQMLSYANLVRTTGGTHVSGFYSALRKILSDYGYEKGLINRKNGPLTWQQLSRGLIAIVHVLHPDPQFQSQTKIKLLNPDVEPVVEQAVSEAFLAFVRQHPDVIEQIVRQCLQI